MPRVRTTKTLAKRIDLQYFTRMDGFRKWRLGLSVALLCCSRWVGLSTRRFPPKKSLHQRALSPRLIRCLPRIANCATAGGQLRATVPDKACLRCHDAPAHNERQTFTPQCSSCHLEHIGRMRIAEVSDSGCVQCHGDLQTKDGQHSVNPHIGGFDKTHPDSPYCSPARPTRAPSTSTITPICSRRFEDHVAPCRWSATTVTAPPTCKLSRKAGGPIRSPLSSQRHSSRYPLVLRDSQQRKRRSVRVGAGAYMTP